MQTLRLRFQNARVALDFMIRSRIRFRKPIHSLGSQRDRYIRIQRELREFFDLGCAEILAKAKGTVLDTSIDSLQVLDIGAKDFVTGPVLEQVFAGAKVHGVEIDAFRRMTDLRCRADYAEYFCSTMRSGHYHHMDFLDWRGPVDVAVLLNPFVTPLPLLRWGLPLRHFRPLEIFAHCRQILPKNPDQSPLLLTSSPTEAERALVHQYALGAEFRHLGAWEWHPHPESEQQQSRFGDAWE